MPARGTSSRRRVCLFFLVSAQSIVFPFPPFANAAILRVRSEREAMEESVWMTWSSWFIVPWWVRT
jgi:Mn2+/Fe2+ NRAMP family transporter